MRIASGLAAFAIIVLAACAGANLAAPDLGVFSARQDIGEVAHAGAVTRDATSGAYAVTGGGANIWGAADAFQFIYAQRAGNLHLATDIAWTAPGGDPHRKAGPMFRQNLSPGSPYVDVMVHGDGLTSIQYRELQDGPTHQIVLTNQAPARVRLEYEDGFVYASISGPDGALRHSGGNFRLQLQEPYFAGLAVSAHDNTRSETALFSNVDLSIPQLATIADTGYAAAVESTLEVLTIGGANQGDRRVVRHFPFKIEAPNWTRDGAALIYNSQGHIWRIPPAGGEPVQINTGPNVKNNNDHGLSPDGTQLIISDQSQPDNISRIYLLPIGGSDHPREVVSHPTARSYWHAWTPDGATIAYTAARPDVTGTQDYDIWSKALAGGPERNLTNNPGLDDGPEFTPDGSRLYWNSTRSGNMHIWRANADGSNPEQVTFDDQYRDWFPHFSPDGRWIAFVSFYASDIPLDDHPPNKSVVLRLMPADGSAPPVILTRLFGGQGTMNVPSWSPDERAIAFVSYRLVR